MIDTNDLAPNDLLFPSYLVSSAVTGVDHEKIEGKEFTMMGVMVYFHGTAFGYVGGMCRCDVCLLAWRSYKVHAESGPTLRSSTIGSVNLTGHMGPESWRAIWHGACDASGIGWRPRVHDTRHAYATHLVGAGVSLNEVKHLMGHRSLDTTMKYQNTGSKRCGQRPSRSRGRSP